MRNVYVGVSNPRGAFEELGPLREKLIAMQGRVRPFGPDYLILDAVKNALDTAAYHFTREPAFYGLKPEQNRAPVVEPARPAPPPSPR